MGVKLGAKVTIIVTFSYVEQGFIFQTGYLYSGIKMSDKDETAPPGPKKRGRKPGSGGRKLGSKNIAGASAKENVLAVFTRLGGTASMARWAEKNLDKFYAIYAKLVPAAVAMDAKVSGDVTVEIVQFTAPAKADSNEK